MIYNGKTPYRHSNDVLDLIKAPEDLVKRYALKPFKLVDLSQEPDEKLRRAKWANIWQLALKHVPREDVLLWIAGLIELFPPIIEEKGEAYVSVVLEYILETGDTSDYDELMSMLTRELPKTLGGQVMTIAQRLQERGVQQGIEQGIEKGKQEGINEGMQRGFHLAAKKMLRENADPAFVAKVTELSLKEIQRLAAAIKQEKETESA